MGLCWALLTQIYIIQRTDVELVIHRKDFQSTVIHKNLSHNLINKNESNQIPTHIIQKQVTKIVYQTKALTESDKGNNNKDVFTSSLVTRGQLNATTTNAAAMTTTTTTTTITTSNANANANASDENEDDGLEDRDGRKPVPCDGLPTRTRDG